MLKYVCNPEKAALIGGSAGRDPETAYSLMKRNKEYWHKTDGSQGFHYIISFPPDAKVDPRMLGNIAEEFSEELLGGRYYYLYAVHTDHAHMHVHIVFDSFSAEDGVKFHSPKGDWERRIQPISDRICRKYGLPGLEHEGPSVGLNHGEWEEAHKEKPEDQPYINHWFDLIRDDIDEAILRSPSYSSFLKYLESLEYTVCDGKYLSLTPKGRARAVRTLRLGKGYSKEEIQQRIEYVRSHPISPDDFRTYGDMETVRRLLFAAKQKNRRWHMNAFQRTFYRRWRNTCLIRKPDFRGRRGSRTIVLSLEELSDNLQFLIHEDIRTEEELTSRRFDFGNERKAVQSELSSVKTQLYRSDICRKVKRREELKEKFLPSADEQEELSRLDEEIEKVMPVSQAVRYRNSLINRKAACLSQLREIRERERLIRSIEWQFEDEQAGALDRGDYREMQRKHEEELRRRQAEEERQKKQGRPEAKERTEHAEERSRKDGRKR